MATIEEAVVAKILSDATLTAILGASPAQRLYPLLIPQDVDLPAIAYQKIDSPKTSSHSGRSDLARSRVQLMCAANDYTGAKALAKAVVACWWGFKGTVAGVRIDGTLIDDDGDESAQAGVPAVRVDLVIWHAE